MDRMIKTRIAGRELCFNFSVAVLLDVIEKYGSAASALETAAAEDREGLEATVFLAALMAADGELCRRAQGLEPRDIPKADFYRHVAPADYVALKMAVIDAVNAGYMRETEDTDEVDLGLAELRAKKASAGDSGEPTPTSLLRSCT